MKLGIPWTAKGIRPEARATAKEAARRSGMSLDDWLTSVILLHAAQAGMQPAESEPHRYDPESYSRGLDAGHRRLDELTQRIGLFNRKRPAPDQQRDRSQGPDPRADLIGRLDQYVNSPHSPEPQISTEPDRAAPSTASVRPQNSGPPTLDRILSEVAARQRALNEATPSPHSPADAAPAAAAPSADPYARTAAALPAQNLSGLEEQLRKITDQIETLRQPGVSDAINALRAELAEISRALQEAMPRRAIETIERQIQNLSDRIAEGRQNGVDRNALANIERGLKDVREALRGLTPAENLVGFNEAVMSLAQKIDLIVAQRDPTTMARLESAITTLRDMANHVASSDAVSALGAEVQSLAEKIDTIARGRSNNDVLTVLGSRIDALAEALSMRADNDHSVSPRLEAMVRSLSDKIEQLQDARAQGNNSTLSRLELLVRSLSEKVERVQYDNNSESVSPRLESLLQALADKLEQIHYDQAQTSGSVPPRLEAMLQALAERLEHVKYDRLQGNYTIPPQLEAMMQAVGDKLGQLQDARSADDLAVRRLEERMATLVARLDASDARFGQLDGIQRGMNDVLGQLRQAQSTATGAPSVPDADGQTIDAFRQDLAQAQDALKHDLAHALDVLKHDFAQAQDVLKDGVVQSHDALKNDIARSQDTLDLVYGTLGHLTERLGTIEHAMFSERQRSNESEPLPRSIPTVKDAPNTAFDHAQSFETGTPRPDPSDLRAQRSDVAIATRGAGDPEIPPDEPLEPGSGRPSVRANPATRIGSATAGAGEAQGASADANNKSNFIAAARRAAQAAMQNEPTPAPKAEKKRGTDERSLRSRMARRVKSLFVAASIVAIVVGSVQIAATILYPGKNDMASDMTAGDASVNPSTVSKRDSKAARKIGQTSTSGATAESSSQVEREIAATPLAMTPPNASINLLAPPDQTVHVATVPPKQSSQAAQPPKGADSGDITGSIPEGATKAASSKGNPGHHDDLPIAIGSGRLRHAAMAGDSGAAYEVASRFAEGRGVPADLAEAAQWYERAADKGLAVAQFRYASLLEKGQGVKKDLLHARRLYLAAARQGNAKAMHNLAVLYAEGVNGKPDYTTAAQWFGKAAAHGVSDSQYNLGILYARGIGVGKSLPEAYKWFALAADQGDGEAGKKRDEVAKHLDAKALAAARRAAADFVTQPQPTSATTAPKPQDGWDKTTATPTAHRS